MEWVDSNSCNVIWALATSSARALLTLSRPIHVPEAALKQAEAKAAKAAAATAEASSGDKEDEAMEEDDDMVRISKVLNFLLKKRALFLCRLFCRKRQVTRHPS